MSSEIYLDANATSPILPAALAAAADAMACRFGNPSSSHAAGIRAKAMLDEVRARAHRVLGAGPGRITFTSGATEAIQSAVLSALCAVRARQASGEAAGKLLLYGATEHKAVPESLAHWNHLLGTGLELRVLPVDEHGRHRLDVLRALAPQAAMLCTMAANNETGVLSDLAGIEAQLRETGSGAFWMVDSVQALGKLALALGESAIDYAPFSGHKLYAPKGVGMLYVRAGAPYTALMAGGGQEAGWRSGTENMAGIAALGAVLAALEEGGVFRTGAELAAFRERLAGALREALPGIVFNAPFGNALPTTLNFSVPGLKAKELLDVFDAAGVRISAGSACSSAKAAPSYVLEAMGLPQWRARAAVRMSFGPLADAAFIESACERIARCGAALRASCLIASGVAPPARDGVIELTADGASSYLVLDAASRGCVVIDPLAALAGRIATLVRQQGYRVRAVLATHVASGRACARAALLADLHDCLDGPASGDPLGWPGGGERVLLGDGTPAGALVLGGQVLARLPHDDGMCASYLLGVRGPDGLAAADVRLAFTGTALVPGGADNSMPLAQMRRAVQRLAALLDGDTILCRAHGSGGVLCSTPGAEARGGGALAELLALQPRLARTALPPMDSVLGLEPSALPRFLATHPDALLVDVREPYEQEAGARLAQCYARAVHSVPLSRLAWQLADWLRAERHPLVFFCRSGGRSASAAYSLHRLGYQNAWHLMGGLALAA